MRIACHQPNFVPWYPFFYKMAMVDTFILLEHVQFEKNGYQNRFRYKDKWITKPVNSGIAKIADKQYVGGEFVGKLNTQWIEVIASTFDIKTRIVNDWLYHETSPVDKTLKLIDIMRSQARYLKYKGGLVYVTNESAKDKYLDEDVMRGQGIDIEYCKVPKNLQKSTFEIIEEYGIEGAIKQLPKKLWRI